MDVSADGTVVVGYSWSENGNSEAFRWEDGVMTGLGDLPGGNFMSQAHGVSADGSVIVGFSSTADGDRAFMWSGGVMTALDLVPGSPGSSKAYGVSADGTVIVGWGDSGTQTTHIEAWRWVNGVPSSLGTFGSDAKSFAYDVSANGSVVAVLADGRRYKAVRWASNVMTSIGMVVPDTDDLDTRARAISRMDW